MGRSEMTAYAKRDEAVYLPPRRPENETHGSFLLQLAESETRRGQGRRKK